MLPPSESGTPRDENGEPAPAAETGEKSENNVTRQDSPGQAEAPVDPKDMNSKAAKDAKEPSGKSTNDAKDAKDPKDAKDLNSKGSKDAKDVKDGKDAKDLHSKGMQLSVRQCRHHLFFIFGPFLTCFSAMYHP